MSFIRSGLVACTALLAAAAGAHPPAPSPAEQAIDYRHSVYHVIAWNVHKLSDAVDGKVPFDKDAFALQAARVAMLAPLLPEGFPDGSYVAGKTDAKPDIWQKRAEFDELMKKLAAKSAALAEVAKSGDLAKSKPAFNELTQVCKSCHDKFKKKDD
ncbi:MAG TPA: cytochrome c [Steroidobacteraceae bacterium]|nr:cytochrome c [Steroidobacteraceae bacterium]